MLGDADVIIVGAGLAGMVAAAEIADAGKRVIVVEQEGEQSLGGQAFWSLGGLFLGQFSRAAAAWASTIPMTSRSRTGWARPASTAKRTLGRAAGRRRMWPSPLARSARGCTRRGMRFFPGRRLGGARRLWRHRPRQLRAALPPHVGNRTRRAAPFMRRVRAAEKRGLVDAASSAIASTS